MRSRTICASAHATGQSIIELTILLPLLLMMIFGLVDLSLAFSTQVQLSSALAEGGYVIAQNPDDEAGARAQILHELRTLNPPPQATDITIGACQAGSGGIERELAIRYQYQPLFGLFGLGPTIELNSRTTVPQFGVCT
ncbi:MAG: TadE/TadG family type IV pilus assembly protein [Oscillochloridaceae bacterium umkhey_bin13]